MLDRGQNKVPKVGDKVLVQSGVSYARDKSYRVGTVIKVNKTRFTVEFKRETDTYKAEYRLDNWRKYGEAAYHTDQAEPFTKEVESKYNAWKARRIAERQIAQLTEKLEEVCRQNIRDPRQEVVSTEDIFSVCNLLEEALEILSPNKTKEESDESRK